MSSTDLASREFFHEKYQALPRPERWMPGPPARWSSIPVSQRQLKISALRNYIMRENDKHFAVDSISENELPEITIENLGDNDIVTQPSAVLVPLIHSNDPDLIDSVLLMTRSMKVSHHKGQVSFPGGMVEPSDENVIETALRETFEETGIAKDVFTVIGTRPVTHTRSRRGVITPVIASCSTNALSELASNVEEVESLHVIPISEFVAPDAYMSEVWDFGEMSPTIHMFFLHDNKGEPVFVWGATAHILTDVLHCL